jgi:hypothetical protein
METVATSVDRQQTRPQARGSGHQTVRLMALPRVSYLHSTDIS